MRTWEGEEYLGFEPLRVMGREVERSMVTGRSADEGVCGSKGVEA